MFPRSLARMSDTNLRPGSIMPLLLSMRFNGVELATGTGFLAETKLGPMLVTALHNLSGLHPDTGVCLSKTLGVPNEITIRYEGQTPGTWIEKREELIDENGKPLWFQHPASNPRKIDAAILPLFNADEGIRIRSVLLAEPASEFLPGPADVVSVCGYPFRLLGGGGYAVWTTGHIATEPTLDMDGAPVFLIDCRSRKGLSGSPVIAYRPSGAVASIGEGEIRWFKEPVFTLIGVYSGRVNEESDLGFVWKMRAILEIFSTVNDGLLVYESPRSKAAWKRERERTAHWKPIRSLNRRSKNR
jgi:hypothetical protein